MTFLNKFLEPLFVENELRKIEAGRTERGRIHQILVRSLRAFRQNRQGRRRVYFVKNPQKP